MKKTLIKNAHLLTNGDKSSKGDASYNSKGNANWNCINGYMSITGDTISYIGEEPPAGSFDEIVDWRHRLVLPGLVNTHNHAAMSLLRGYADDMALQVWLEDKIWPMEGKFTAEDVRWGTLLSILEMVKGGTTCFVDMYDHMDEVAGAVEQSGMRACLTRGVIGLCSPQERAAKLLEAKQFAVDWHGRADGRITTMMSPHAPYTCPPEYIAEIVQAARELALPIHIHMSETLREVEEHERQYGLRPVAHLEQLGVFDLPCLVAHAVHLTDKEMTILQRHSVHISHNPGSNLKLASGIARIPKLLKAGLLISLGTDSAASNNNLDMFEEMRLAALIHKGSSGDPIAVAAGEALRMGTLDGARSIWLDKVGRLAVGYQADFIAVDIDQPHFLPETDYISHLIYSASAHDVTDVCINGRWIVRGREALTLDEEKIKHAFRRCFARLNGS